MLYGLKTILTYLTGTDIAGRNLAVYPDDTFLVSYPRSGNTWMRFLIANLVFPDENIDFTNIERLIPDNTSGPSLRIKRTPRPRIIKSHEYFDHRYPKTIYIVRDPRDVVLSYYNHNRKYRHIEDRLGLEQFVNAWVTPEGVKTAGWGTWGENVASWAYTRGGSSSFLLLRYEDMLQDTITELARAAAFLDIEPEIGRLKRAIELSSAERMRKLEKLQEDEWLKTQSRVMQRARENKTRKDIPFVAQALAGGWRNSLPESCVHTIESAWGSLLVDLGYDLVTISYPHRALPLRASANASERS
jgi:hypothetical protein